MRAFVGGSGAMRRLGILVLSLGVPLLGSAAGCLAGEAREKQSGQRFFGPGGSDGEGDHCRGCQTYRFRLLRGEHPVCSVYAERLAATPVRHPFCNFDFSAGFKGIQEFPKRRLSSREIYEVAVKVEEFDRGRRGSVTEAPWPLRIVEQDQGHALDAWVIDGGADIDRDGSPERILLWSDGPCWGAGDNRQNVRAYVLEGEDLSIDWEKTVRLFVRLEEVWVVQDHWHNFIAQDIGVFEYEGRTFVSGQRPTEQQGNLMFEVYRYRDDRVETVCSVQWEREE